MWPIGAFPRCENSEALLAYVYIFKFLVWLWLRIETKIFKTLVKSPRSSVESHIVLEMGPLQWVWPHTRLSTIAARGRCKGELRGREKLQEQLLWVIHRHTHVRSYLYVFFLQWLTEYILCLTLSYSIHLFFGYIRKQTILWLSKLLNLRWFLCSQWVLRW